MNLFDKLVELALHVGFAIYAYCTDFVINVANITGLSYYEINAILFCFLFPGTLLLMMAIYVRQRMRLKQLVNSPHKN